MTACDRALMQGFVSAGERARTTVFVSARTDGNETTLRGPSEPGAWEVLEEDKGDVPPLPGTAGAARGSRRFGCWGHADKQSSSVGDADAAYEQASYSEWTWAREGAKATDDVKNLGWWERR